METNATFTFASTSHDEERDVLFSYTSGTIFTIILGLLSAFGLIANCTTFMTVATSSVLRKSPFNIFIMSLSLSDFVSSLNSPFQIYRLIWGYLEYRLPVAVCKITVGVSQWTTFVTVQHIVAFSLARVLAIQFPRKLRYFTAKWAKIVALFIWIEVYFSYALFYMIAATVVPYSPGRYKTACTGVSKQWKHVGEKYIDVGLPIMLFAPFIVVLVCAIVTTVILIKLRWKRDYRSMLGSHTHLTESGWDILPYFDDEDVEANLTRSDFGEGNIQERSTLVQVSLIVLSFLIGYSMNAAYLMTKALHMRSLFTPKTKWLILTLSYILLRLSECLNPLFYNLASSQLRKSSMKLLGNRRTPVASSSTNLCAWDRPSNYRTAL